MPNKDDIKKVISNALSDVASAIFINRILAIIDDSAETTESFVAASDKIRNRVALFIDEDFAAKLSDLLKAEIGEMQLNRGTRRKHVRVDFRNKVNLTYLGKVYELNTTNISEGGINIEAEKPFPVGSKIEISLPLRGGNVTISGVVVNAKEGRGRRPSTMGIQFTGVSNLVLSMLKSIIKKASPEIGHGGSEMKDMPAGKSDARP